MTSQPGKLTVNKTQPRTEPQNAYELTFVQIFIRRLRYNKESKLLLRDYKK